MTNIEKRGFHSILAETAVGVVGGLGVNLYILNLEVLGNSPVSRKKVADMIDANWRLVTAASLTLIIALSQDMIPVMSSLASLGGSVVYGKKRQLNSEGNSTDNHIKGLSAP